MKWHTLLIIVVAEVVYIVVGGVIIHFLETPNEQHESEIAMKEYNNFRALKSCVTTEDVQQLTSLLNQLRSSGLEPPIRGDLVYGTSWDFQSSIYMTMQVISTIGFGASPPKTAGGKVFLVFFAIIGIPIFIIAAFGLGDQLVRLSEYIRSRIFKVGVKHAILVHVFRTAILLIIGIIIFNIIPAAIFSVIQPDLSYGRALSIISVIAIGYGNFIPNTNHDTIFLSWYRFGVGIWAITSMLWFAGLYASVRCLIIAYNSSPLEVPDTFNQKKKKQKKSKLKQSIDVGSVKEAKLTSPQPTSVYHVPDVDASRYRHIENGPVSTIIIH